MSSRARRAADSAVIVPFAWPHAGAPPPAAPPADPEPGREPLLSQAHLATLERDAFAKGFAQGERAGAEAAASRGEAMIRRLTQTLEEVAALRSKMIRDTEQQMVRLALAVARRIIHREISLDQDLLLAIARVAMDRLGESAQVTVRLHPDDLAATAAVRESPWSGGHVVVVADARLPRGGCRIESDLGIVDAGIDAQLQEVAQALLSDATVVVPHGHER